MPASASSALAVYCIIYTKPNKSDANLTESGVKMNIKVDTHTHTNACAHAYSTLLENLAAAKKAGLEAMGWSEHIAPMPDAPKTSLFANLLVLDREIEGVRLLRSVELNICGLDGSLGVPEEKLRFTDYCIASMHSAVLESGTAAENTDACIKVMHNPKVRILGHPDDSRFPLDYKRLVAAARKTGTLLEVNNSSLRPTSYRVGARENLVEMLTLCKEQGVFVSVGSDAHFAAAVGRFAEASALFDELDFPEELVVCTSYDKFRGFIGDEKKPY